ncbi:YcjF family protein [Desulfomicrobium escambiense]|uniref:YcjF family protein n=1 Tax=Desulfomicrobium escambiense TaxID=29503 RepID=UPI00041E1F92|nr:DUF697 domain-containing protein [Desulfomicrobium escambiense]
MATKNSEMMTEAEGQDRLNLEPMPEETAEAVAAALPSECEIDALIRKRVYAAIGVGFVPLPLVDLAGLTAVQLEMIHALTKAYGLEFKKERAKSILSSLGSGVVSVAAVPLFASLFKSLPIVGTTAGSATISIVGGASTYAMGKVFDRHFRKGGNLLNFDAQGAKAYFKTKFEEGKGVVAKMKPGKKADAAEPATESGATA